MSYLNSITIVGFVGADPEQRQARNNNGSKFTVLSVATQRSWKNTDDEWASKTEWHRVCVFRPRLAEYVATTINKDSHVLVEGSLVSTKYERGNGKCKKVQESHVFRIVKGVGSAQEYQSLPSRSAKGFSEREFARGRSQRMPHFPRCFLRVKSTCPGKRVYEACGLLIVAGHSGRTTLCVLIS
jgi:single-strand DNA-binding protein